MKAITEAIAAMSATSPFGHEGCPTRELACAMGSSSSSSGVRGCHLAPNDPDPELEPLTVEPPKKRSGQQDQDFD